MLTTLPSSYSRHRCPHKPHGDLINRSSQPCALSEYTQQFKKYSAKPRESLKPPQKALTRDAKIESLTINRQDYVAHPVTPTPPKVPVVYAPPEGTIDSSSEYKNQYQGNWAIPAKLIRPPQTRKDTREPFNHKSTHSTEFIAYSLQPQEKYGNKHVYEPPTEQFDAQSTVQMNFVDFGRVESRKSLKPPQEAKLSTEALDGTTSYRLSFSAPLMPERYQRPKEVYKPSKGEFCDTTTFQRDFHAHSGAKVAESMKPPQKAIASDIPFDGTTVSRLSYRSWELPARHSRPPTVYSPPKERFATESSFRADFPNYGWIKPTQSMKPPLSKEQVAPFQSLTTQCADYKVWKDIERPMLLKQEKKYEPPNERFDAISTFQAHYKGESTPRAPSAKPPETPRSRSCGMETTTMYRDSYSRTGCRPCPALLLPGTTGGPTLEYTFSHKHPSTGHLFFSPIKDTDQTRLAATVTS